MTAAIVILIILGALDAMLYIACVELEKEDRNERSNSEADE